MSKPKELYTVTITFKCGVNTARWLKMDWPRRVSETKVKIGTGVSHTAYDVRVEVEGGGQG